jgi:hypothetical protein
LALGQNWHLAPAVFTLESGKRPSDKRL